MVPASVQPLAISTTCPMNLSVATLDWIREARRSMATALQDSISLFVVIPRP